MLNNRPFLSHKAFYWVLFHLCGSLIVIEPVTTVFRFFAINFKLYKLMNVAQSNLKCRITSHFYIMNILQTIFILPL